MTTHTSENMFSCEVCQRKFRDIHSMKRHISILHTKHKPFSCAICQQTFTLKFSLKNHEELHKGLEIKCEACEKMFTTQNHLKKHIRLKHKPKVQSDASTTTCKKTLSDAWTLSRHNLLVHSKNRPFSCKSCSKTFALHGMMNSHIRESHVRKEI